MSKFVFVTGGVMSSIGKGITAASIATLLQARGFTIKMKKLDPYINIDPGTISPYKHGEVYVMSDGCEADLDFGHYERFTDIECSKFDSITTGKVYNSVLIKERAGTYLGSDIQVIPHITDEIKLFITQNNEDADFVICEIGGTVGDIESLPFIESLREMKLEKTDVVLVHLTYLPYIRSSGEIKTKPSQHSVKTLQSLGVCPDILVCRTERRISDGIRNKLSKFCNVKKENVVEAIDVESIYLAPKEYHASGLDIQICKYFNIDTEEKIFNKNISEKWLKLERVILEPARNIKIAVVGKYTKLKDAYLSLSQAIIHAGFANDAHVDVEWVDSDQAWSKIEAKLKEVRGIIIPGGFGDRGIETKIEAIRYARENKVPFLGICLGMQLAVIEACRNIANLDSATSREFNDEGDFVVDFMNNWKVDEDVVTRKPDDDMGGTMRLGNYECKINKDSLAFKIYQKELIKERHRHRYEVNIGKYKDVFDNAQLFFSGMSLDGRLPEILERKDHPFFIAMQSHPEFNSRPFAPHPVFTAFLRAAI